MKRIVRVLVLSLMIIVITACGINVKKMEKEVQVGIQDMFDKDYKTYEIVVNSVKITGEKTYKGTVEFLYKGKSYIQPVIIKSTDKEYSYEFKFNPYVIKEEAEKALVSKLLLPYILLLEVKSPVPSFDQVTPLFTLSVKPFSKSNTEVL